jgi:asparagine synthase (glutamine-hydrolysing)
MCGISGRFSNQLLDEDIVGVVEACRRQHHRGPDFAGVAKDKYVAFGHNRLAIVDLDARSNQPFILRAGGRELWVAFNGEIYNHLDLRTALSGFSFKTLSDTETFAFAFMRWDVGCFSKLEGMWSVAIYDRVDRRVILSRDRFGEKPLFYGTFDDGLYFASEMKGFAGLSRKFKLSDEKISLAIKNPKYLAASNASLIEGVENLTPGTYYECRLRDERVVARTPVRYWDFPSIEDSPINRSIGIDDVEAVLRDSVRRTSFADVPVGNQLSGGLDSSLLCGLISVEAPNITQAAFHFRLKESGRDELNYAADVATHCRLPLVVTELRPEMKAGDSLLKFVYQLESISPDFHFGVFQNFKAISDKGIKVVLDGNGADELFVGYQHMVSAIRQQALGRFFSSMTDDAASTYVHSFVCSRSFDGGSTIESFSLEGDLKAINQKNKDVSANSFFSFVRDISVQEMTLRSLPTILWNWDRLSMANSIEVRLPFLTSKLVEMAIRAPLDVKVQSGYSKYALRRIAEKYIPHHVAWRTNKFGFAFPFDYWFRVVLFDSMRALWSDLNLATHSNAVVDAAVWRDDSLETIVTQRKHHLLWQIWQAAALKYAFSAGRQYLTSSEVRVNVVN